MYDLSTEARAVVVRLLKAIWPPPPAFVAAPPKKKDTAPDTTAPPKTPPLAAKVIAPKFQPIGSRVIEPTTGPRGWLGAVFAHGVACLSYEIAFMRHHQHFTPSVRADWDNSKSRSDIDHSSHSLMTYFFDEWQAPCFDWQSPDFFGTKKGPVTSHWSNQIALLANGDSAFGGGDLYAIVDHASVRHVKDGLPDCGSPVGQHPATNVQAWSVWIAERGHHGDGRAIGAGAGLLFPNLGREIAIPKYWNSCKTLRELWAKRLVDWYWTAQWAVWCVEMMRLHYEAGPATMPDWWASYAASWGVFVRKVSRGHRYTNHVITPGSKHHKAVVIKGSRKGWIWFAEKVRDLAGVPGDPDNCGAQIATEETSIAGRIHKRHIFDIPLSAGSLRPPTCLMKGMWNGVAVSWWGQHREFKSLWEKWVIPIVNACVSIIATVVGAGEFVAFQALANGIFAVVTQVMQLGAALANGKLPDYADVVALLGDVVDLAGGAENCLPEDVWRQLKAAESQFHGFEGKLRDQLVGKAEEIRGVMVPLNEVWPYVDEGLGGIIGSPL